MNDLRLSGRLGQIAGALLGDIFVAQQHDQWPRLKACRNRICSVIFYEEPISGLVQYTDLRKPHQLEPLSPPTSRGPVATGWRGPSRLRAGHLALARVGPSFGTEGTVGLPWIRAPLSFTRRVKGKSMTAADSTASRGLTSDGGVIVGRSNAKRSLDLFEDPQCPYCRQFEELNGETVSAHVSAGKLRVEYRMRCFLGQESVRADNALALAAESGRVDDLRRDLFAAQPTEGSGGFATEDLIDLGEQVGLTDPDFVSGIHQGRYEDWVLRREARYQQEDPLGTPAAWLDSQSLDSGVLFDPTQFAGRFRD